MNKPNNYENTQAAGDYKPIELGGHILEIKKVEETMARSGRPMLRIFFDMARTDKQAGYFAQQFKDDIRPDKKWPFGGTAYILTEDADGNCTKTFKGFITSVEKSNAGFSTVWGQLCSLFYRKVGRRRVWHCPRLLQRQKHRQENSALVP